MPSSILNSDDGVISGTSGLKSTGGDDGVLVFQSKGTETARINTDKQIVAAAGTASLPVLTTTGDVNTGIYFPAADNIGFATGGTIRGRWTTDGLCFGSDTAAANALDDYEEGTWTPTYVPETNSFSAITYDVQEGYYTKIGNMVNVRLFLRIASLTKGTASGSVSVASLPFTPVNSRSIGTVWSRDFLGDFPSLAQPTGGGDIFLYYRTTANGSANNLLQVSDLDTGNTDNSIILSLMYQAS